MTELNPSPSPTDTGLILAYEPPPRGQQRFDRIGTWIGWTVSIAIVVLVVGLNLYASILDARQRAAAASSNGISTPVRKNRAADPSAPSIEILMTGRIAIGSRYVLSSLQAMQQGKSAAPDMTAVSAGQIRELAVTPLEKLRAATILAELRGKEVALSELNELPKATAPDWVESDARSLRTIYTAGPDALDPSARQSLIERHGWFGQLAVTFGKAQSDPARRAALAPAYRAIWVEMGFGAAILVGFVAGLVLAIIALVSFVKGRIRSAYAPSASAPPSAPAWPPNYPPYPGIGGAYLVRHMPASYPFPPPPPPPPAPIAVTAGSSFNARDGFGSAVPPSEGSVLQPTADAAAPPRGAPFIEAFAIFMAGLLVVPLLGHFLFRRDNVVSELMMIAFVPFPILWPRLRGISKPEWKRAIGWHAGRGALREAGCGLLGYLAGLPLLAAGLVLALSLTSLAHAKPTHPIEFEFGKGAWPLVKVFILACVWAPIVEETMFRGMLFHHLRLFGKGWSWLRSALLVSFLFAAIHPQGWTFIPVLGSLAVTLAAIREWRGTLISSMTAHFIQNFVTLIFMAGVLG